MVNYKTLDDLFSKEDVRGKRILVRADLNVPVCDEQVTDTTRIQRILPTLTELVQKQCKVIILSHFGRPKGKKLPEMSLSLAAKALSNMIDATVVFAADCIGNTAENSVKSLKDGEILILENTRFYPEEETNNPQFAASLAKNGDIYVNDAFSAAHRAHASTEGITHYLPSYAGRTLQKEIEALNAALSNPEHPLLAIVGGAKISTKLALLNNFISKVDFLVIGGAMANTFLAAENINVGRSLIENSSIETANNILKKAKASNCHIILPIDVVTATELSPGIKTENVPITNIADNMMILDIGDETIKIITSHLNETKTVIWNGPVGAFETQPFDNGTNKIAKHIAYLSQNNNLLSVAGGGDTVAALNHAQVLDKLSYVSAAGGAFLEWMEGVKLPGILALENK